jgi:hypothetical protein
VPAGKDASRAAVAPGKQRSSARQTAGSPGCNPVHGEEQNAAAGEPVHAFGPQVGAVDATYRAVNQGHDEEREAGEVDQPPRPVAYVLAEIEAEVDYSEEIEGDLAETNSHLPVTEACEGAGGSAARPYLDQQ